VADAKAKEKPFPPPPKPPHKKTIHVSGHFIIPGMIKLGSQFFCAAAERREKAIQNE
jgi:hypothetical protein